MSYLTTVVGSFHGRVLAARLGAEGVLVMLKGTTDGPYPLPSAVDVLVPADQLKLAREILLADAVDDAFGDMELAELTEVPNDELTRRFGEETAGDDSPASLPSGGLSAVSRPDVRGERRRPARVRGLSAGLVVLLVATLVVVACLAAATR